MCRAILSLAIVISLGIGAAQAQDRARDQEARPWWQTEGRSGDRPDRDRPDRDRPAVDRDRPAAERDRPPLRGPDFKIQGMMIQVLMATVAFDETGKLVVTSEEEGQPAESETVAVGTLPTLFAEYQNKAAASAAAPTLGSADAVNRLLAGLRKAGALERLVRPQLLTVDGQEATVQAGYHEPKITGVSRSARGQTNTVTLENLGTLVAATPRVVPDGRVLIELSVETSDFGPEDEGTVVATSDDGPQIRSPRTDTHSIHTTVSTRDGQTVVVSDQIRASSDKVSETFVLLTAHVLD